VLTQGPFTTFKPGGLLSPAKQGFQHFQEIKEYCPWKSRHIIEQIDDVLAEHYELTPDELNFLKTCDMEFRVGEENVDSGEDETDEE